MTYYKFKEIILFFLDSITSLKKLLLHLHDFVHHLQFIILTQEVDNKKTAHDSPNIATEKFKPLLLDIRN